MQVPRREAEQKLLLPGTQRGTYLIRPCSGTCTYAMAFAFRSSPLPPFFYRFSYHFAFSNLHHVMSLVRERERVAVNNFSSVDQVAIAALSVRDVDQSQQLPIVRHYKVRRLDNNRGYYVAPQLTFPSFNQLITYYMRTFLDSPFLSELRLDPNHAILSLFSSPLSLSLFHLLYCASTVARRLLGLAWIDLPESSANIHFHCIVLCLQCALHVLQRRLAVTVPSILSSLPFFLLLM